MFRHTSILMFAALALHCASAVHSSSAIAGDIAYGQHLSGECATCHRADGQDKGIPSIIGWPADQFVAVLKAYQDKDRPNQVMQTIASRLANDEVDALAAYYATLKPAIATK